MKVSLGDPLQGQLLALRKGERSKLQEKTALPLGTCGVKDSREKVSYLQPNVGCKRRGRLLNYSQDSLFCILLLGVNCSQICLYLWIRDGRGETSLDCASSISQIFCMYHLKLSSQDSWPKDS